MNHKVLDRVYLWPDQFSKHGENLNNIFRAELIKRYQ